jgi:hypothetical protein
LTELVIRRFADANNPFPTYNTWELLSPTPTDLSASYWICGYDEVKLSFLATPNKEWRLLTAHNTLGDNVCNIGVRRGAGKRERWTKWFTGLMKKGNTFLS